jgi:F-type H+-transporting ATPase subunit delta
MKNITVARRYAKALYELAADSRSVDDVLQGMSNLSLAFREAVELQSALLNPVISPEDKQRILKTVTSNKLVLRFVDLLVHRKRLTILPEVYDQLLALSDQAKGIRRAVVKTAVSLSESQKRAIESDLAKRLGGTIIGKFEIAAELIGGMLVQLGDHVLDASLKRRIEDFRQALVHSAN